MKTKSNQNVRRPGNGAGARRPQGGAREVRSSDIVPTSTNPLKLGFIDGTQGAGRVAATFKAGLIEAGSNLTGAVEHSTSNYGIYTIPTVAVVDWAPCLGALANDRQKAVFSSAIYKFYNYIRSRNASVSAYSPNDILFALEAVAGVATLLGHIRVCLQLLFSAGSQLTTAYPHVLMEALGLTSADRTDLQSYVVRYNQIVELAKGLIIPKSYKLFARRGTLASTVYLDDPLIAKSQLIVMRPKYYYYWDVDAASPTVGKLVCAATPSGLSNMLSRVESLIKSYTLDVDMNNIYAELRKAFETPDVYTFQPFPTMGEPLNVTYDQVLLDQLHNGTLCGYITTGMEPTVEENASTGDVVYTSTLIGVKPVITMSNSSNAVCVYDEAASIVVPGATTNNNDAHHRIYAHDDQPDELSTADLCAFKVSFGYTTNTGGATNSVLDAGTELLLTVHILEYQNVAGTVNYIKFEYASLMKPYEGQGTGGTANGVGIKEARAERAYLTFGYLPVIEHTKWTSYGSPTTYEAWTYVLEGDVDNRYPISGSALSQIHDATIAWLVAM
jgi:hypothetical protein